MSVLQQALVNRVFGIETFFLQQFQRVLADHRAAQRRFFSVGASGFNLYTLPESHVAFDLYSLGRRVGVKPHGIGIHLTIDKQ